MTCGTLMVYLDERAMQHLASLAHLLEAEKLDENPDALRTGAGDFMPPDIDSAIYEALAKAVLDHERQR